MVTLAQIFVAVCILAPSGPLWYRYTTLVQHDGYWFANIVDRGYGTTVPPLNRKMMEVSNVAFFPAYPLVAMAVKSLLHVDTYVALLIVAQLAAWGFWTYFFLFCQRWEISPRMQFIGTLSILSHPAAFFMVAGYSESMFMMSLLGFMYWSTSESRNSRVWAALHGIVMSATRIVGILCAGFPVVHEIVTKGWKRLRDYRSWLRNYGGAVFLSAVAMLGAGLFFLYCQLRWGHWDTYLLTQQLGWNIIPDYLAVFKPSSYQLFIPRLDYPLQVSQVTMTLAALVFVAIFVFETRPAIRARGGWEVRAGIYFAAAIIYYISVSGVAIVQMESMLRYHLCTHALIVLAILHVLRQIRRPPQPVREWAMAAIGFLSALGLCLQGWYVWNFTRGNWVA